MLEPKVRIARGGSARGEAVENNLNTVDGSSRLRYYYAVSFGVSFVKGHKLKGTRDTQLISQAQVVVLALSPLFREKVKRPTIHLQCGAKRAKRWF